MAHQVLSRIQSFHLMNFIKEFYINENMSDKKFAEFAGKQLGFPVTEGHIYHARSSLEIPAWQPKRASKQSVLDRLEYLEQVVAKVCKDLDIKL